jgi:hypothetical protein
VGGNAYVFTGSDCVAIRLTDPCAADVQESAEHCTILIKTDSDRFTVV